MKRQAASAGSFYKAGQRACTLSAAQTLDAAALPADLPATIFGGLVPHAGWVFSGRIAAMTLKALALRNRLTQVVIFGADHWGIAGAGAVFDTGAWETPLGDVAVDEELAAELLKACPLLTAAPAAHAREHSIEVQLPLLHTLNRDVRIVPINVAPQASAIAIGQAVGELLAQRFPRASVLGSTDLTHYGPQYGFMPGGAGRDGLEWARENDRRLLKLVETLRAPAVIEEARARQNACGAGAIAAAIAACAAMGATRGLTLDYTTSAEVMEQTYHTRADDAVGYASVVFA
jgi:AmmeMemoRadiSam system protein B